MNISYRSGPGWYVAYCQPNQQNLAKCGIEGIGFRVEMPVEKLRRRKQGRMVTIERPLFGPYIFFELDPHKFDWQPILNIDGVQDVLCNNDIPVRVPLVELQRILREVEYGLYDKTPDSPKPFEIGQSVRIGEGKFSGYQAVVKEFASKWHSATATKRAKVLINFFGRLSEIDIDVCALERA